MGKDHGSLRRKEASLESFSLNLVSFFVFLSSVDDYCEFVLVVMDRKEEPITWVAWFYYFTVRSKSIPFSLHFHSMINEIETTHGDRL